MLCRYLCSRMDIHANCVSEGHFGEYSVQVREGSLPISAVNAAATWYHRRRRYFDSVDYFVTTTRFMYEMMLSAGYAPERLVHIPTFVDSDFFHPSDQREVQAPLLRLCWAVGLRQGVHILLDACSDSKRATKAEVSN